MKTVLSLAALLLVASAVSAQKKPERPKVHADFYFGSIPPSREAAKAMAQDKARLVMVGYHEGWSEDKIAKELKWATREVDGIQGDLSDIGLLGRRNTDVIPAVLVVRDRDMRELDATLQRHIRDFATVLQPILAEAESMLFVAPTGPNAGAAGLPAPARDLPEAQRRYVAMVGGILFGGMIEVFADDKTFMPAPPQGAKGQFYGWLVESEPSLAGKIQREVWDSESYQIISVGPGLAADRPQLEDVRRNGWVIEEPASRRFRTYALVTSRDKLLPFFKAERDELLKAHRTVQSGRYSPFKNFFAWYYNTLVNGAVERLQASGQLDIPKEPYAYALKTPVR